MFTGDFLGFDGDCLLLYQTFKLGLNTLIITIHFLQIQSLHALKYNKLAKMKLQQFQTKFSKTPATDRALKTIADNVSAAIENNQKGKCYSQVCFSWIRILCFESGIFEGLQKVEK
jgi:hypothetical protein